MSTTDERYDKTERILKRARPLEPSDELREWVMDAARKAWKETPAEVPWQIPFRRLAMSAAAAIVIVSSANFVSDHAVGQWRADRPVVTRAPVANSDETWDAPRDLFVQHLVAVRRASARDPLAVIDSAERMREMLQEIEQRLDEVDESDPAGTKSGLLPGGSNSLWHV